jgi:hypothetical protein
MWDWILDNFSNILKYSNIVTFVFIVYIAGIFSHNWWKEKLENFIEWLNEEHDDENDNK